MSLTLTDRDCALLDGAHGAAAQIAMSIVVQMAHVFGARALMDITAAHIDSTIYIGARLTITEDGKVISC